MESTHHPSLLIIYGNILEAIKTENEGHSVCAWTCDPCTHPGECIFESTEPHTGGGRIWIKVSIVVIE